jgi:hypothetical protein
MTLLTHEIGNSGLCIFNMHETSHENQEATHHRAQANQQMKHDGSGQPNPKTANFHFMSFRAMRVAHPAILALTQVQ